MPHPMWDPASREVALRASAFDATSFSAGEACGARVAACTARLAAIELVDQARWWNRRRCRLMASALVACAEELEDSAGGSEPTAPRARGG